MIRWLHLSDLHVFFNNHTNCNIKDSLITYLSDLDRQFDFVLITGDIAYQGNYVQDVGQYFEEIAKLTNCSLENFYVCIGNHDVTRNDLRSNTVISVLNEYTKNEKLSEEQYDYLFRTGHKKFINIIKGISPSIGNMNEPHYFINKPEYSITIINTCLFSHSLDDKEKLYINDVQ